MDLQQLIPLKEERSFNKHILDLPWDDIIVGHIIKRITIQDCFTLKKVGYPFGLLVDSYFKTIKSLRKLDVQKLSPRELHDLASQSRHLQYLELESCDVDSETVRSFITNNPFLTELNLSSTKNIDDNCLHPLIFCKEMKRLVLKDCLWVSAGCLATLRIHLPWLICVVSSRTVQGISVSSCNAVI